MHSSLATPSSARSMSTGRTPDHGCPGRTGTADLLRAQFGLNAAGVLGPGAASGSGVSPALIRNRGGLQRGYQSTWQLLRTPHSAGHERRHRTHRCPRARLAGGDAGRCSSDPGGTLAERDPALLLEPVHLGLLSAAAATGTTVVAARGDDGSSGCHPQTDQRPAQYSAASPSVTSVGGIQLAPNALLTRLTAEPQSVRETGSQVGWNQSPELMAASAHGRIPVCTDGPGCVYTAVGAPPQPRWTRAHTWLTTLRP